MYDLARKLILNILIDQLNAQMKRDGNVAAMKSFQFVVFCLLVLNIIGGKEKRMKGRKRE
jgi:hypothetical protein